MFDPVIAISEVAARLGDQGRRFDIDWVACCGSTNTELLARAEAGAASGSVLVAREQTAGRGRRGHTWHGTPGDSLTFSLFWRFPPRTAPAGLSLAVGLALARAIDAVDPAATPVRLKWPNDLLRERRKLGGILIELLPGAPHAAVIGIGINRRLPAGLPAELRDRSAALAADVPVTALLAESLHALLPVLEGFGRQGFAPFRTDWEARHAYRDTPVRLLADHAPPREVTCLGVDDDGALRVLEQGREQRVLAGEISLREAA